MEKKHLEILTEEPSAEAALKILLPKIVGVGATFKIITHQGKYDLLKQLPSRLKAYRKTLGTHDRIIVLIDKDKDNCDELKNKMEQIATSARLISKTKAGGQPFQIVNRIAIEEMESWFLGDELAVCTSFPSLSNFPGQYSRRQPDSIPSSWETLERILKGAGYRSIGGKIEVARKIARHMNPERNRSKSFGVFVAGINACL